MTQFHSKSTSLTEICGVIHIHTTFSDGGVGFSELADAAQEAGLDYVIVTDHMTLRGKTEGLEGFVKGVLVVVGYEHHDQNNTNHYLVLGTDTVFEDQSKPQRYIDGVKKLGGIGFLAHPMERRHYFKQYPPYPWTDWTVEGFDGIEVWNQMSEWVENLKRWRSYLRVLYPRRFLTSIPPPLRHTWDAMNRQRFVAGIGGVDAHTMRIKAGLFTLRVFPIKVELKGIRTHLYIPAPLERDKGSEAEKTVLQCLRDGHGFISNYRRGDARGSRIVLETGEGEIVPPGTPRMPTKPPCTIHVDLPMSAEVRLIRNGELCDISKGVSSTFDIDETGLYRIEAFRKGRAWVYSNPFPVGAYPL